MDLTGVDGRWRGMSAGAVFALIAAVYLLATFSAGPRTEAEMQGIAHLRLGPLVFSRPLVLSGDAPHYLVAVHSLLAERDFDLRDNYDRAAEGGWEAGARFRGVTLDRHADEDRRGRQPGTHSFFMAALLALLTAPLGVGPWTESWAIWWTMAAGLAGIWLTGRWVEARQPGEGNQAMLLLGLATPLLCYSRDLWSEPWILMLWMAGLLCRRNWGQGALGFVATLLKYPYAVVPFTLGLVAVYRRDYRRGAWLIGSATAAVVVVVGTVQWQFRDVGHFSLFHSGAHRSFDLPLDGLIGLLLDPRSGLAGFFPILLLGLGLGRRKEWGLLLPAAAFVLVHASYADWAGGTGFSSRYLVPVLPLLVLGLLDLQPKERGVWIVRALLLYSAIWGILGGFLPAIVYDRSPWQVAAHVWAKLTLG